MTSEQGAKRFSPWRAFFWPVHRHELRKLMPMLAIFFLLSFDYNILRCMKDPFVITAKHSGAEIIPFIKVWVLFPMSLALTWIFMRFSSRFSKEQVVYYMLSIFLSFFFIFGFVLYPLRDYLHPHESADYLQAILPKGLKGFIAMYRYWLFTSFYVMSELWSNIILSMLFWGFANQVTTIDESKRFYGLFGVGINLSGIASGVISIAISRMPLLQFLGYQSENERWGQSMILLIVLVLVAGVAAMFLFSKLSKLTQDEPTEEHRKEREEKENKQKFSIRENMRYLASSQYVRSLALIIISYNIVINLVEVLWKHEVKELYRTPQEYSIFMNQITTLIGVLATGISLFVSANSIRKFGWTTTAMITPAILLITSIGFFTFFFMKQWNIGMLELCGVSPLGLVVFFGSLQNCFSRAAKYTLFDATKEMAFVPLSPEDKIKSKAAVDGICNRLGKSAGSVIYQILLLFFSSITASVPYVAVFLLAAIIGWLLAVRKLGQEFTEMGTSLSTRKEAQPQNVEAPATIFAA